MKPISSSDLGIVQVWSWDGIGYRFGFGARFGGDEQRDRGFKLGFGAGFGKV